MAYIITYLMHPGELILPLAWSKLF